MIEDTHSIYPESDFEFVDTGSGRPIKVIGVGNSGVKAVGMMCDDEPANVSFAVCSPYRETLEGCHVEEKVLLGGGKKPGAAETLSSDFGIKCAMESRQAISSLFSDSTELVVIVAGMGRNTASGAAKEIARMAREAGKITLAVITLPFLFEGMNTNLRALEATADLQKFTDANIIINQDCLPEVYSDFNFVNSFKKTDETLANIVNCIANLASGAGRIPLDIDDVKSALKEAGTAIAYCAAGYGDNRVTDALRNVLLCPLFKKLDTFSPRKMLVKITSPNSAETTLKTNEVEEITKFISEINPPLTEFHWGVGYDDALDGQVIASVLATGISPRITESLF